MSLSRDARQLRDGGRRHTPPAHLWDLLRCLRRDEARSRTRPDGLILVNQAVFDATKEAIEELYAVRSGEQS